MPRHAFRAAPQRPPAASPVLQAKTASDTRCAIGAPTAGFSFATVPVGAAPRGLPSGLRAGVEALSGLTMDDVRVHRNSAAPAALGAHAFTRDGDIHLGPGEDRHLPHEAWHVAQQKQGRVAATGRLGGAPASDDAGLEAEADRMGARAAAVRSEAHRAPAPAPPAADRGVIQAKLISQGKEVRDDPSLSEASRRHVKSQETFLLRDDLTPQAKEIHVLKPSLKVLLGEFHRTGVFEAETKPWTSVPQMTEGFKMIPHEAADTGRVFDAANPQLTQAPLESAHPYLFATLVRAQGNVHELLDRLRTSPATPSEWSLWVGSALSEIGELKLLYFDNYKRFAQIFEREFPTRPQAGKTPRPAPPRLQRIFDVAARLRDAHGDGGRRGLELVELTRVLNDVKLEIGAPRATPPGFAAAAAAKIARHEAFLTDLAREVVPILSAEANEAKTLDEILAQPDQFRRPDALTATNPIRERSMAEAIRAAPAPLFVQLGMEHAPRVAKLVGPDAVAVLPPRTLSDLTRKTY